ncbi:hypothetical protein QUF72_20645 [Desulfobacterales bacterium HSG2]|nr:hypothetical protein [Desulfobacterales bacterium HSG2]
MPECNQNASINRADMKAKARFGRIDKSGSSDLAIQSERRWFGFGNPKRAGSNPAVRTEASVTTVRIWQSEEASGRWQSKASERDVRIWQSERTVAIQSERA